jgi:hypothetical protein
LDEAGGEESPGEARRSRLPELAVGVQSRFDVPNTHHSATNMYQWVLRNAALVFLV